MTTSEHQERYETMLKDALNARLAVMNRRSLLRAGAVAGGAALAFGTVRPAFGQGSGTSMSEDAPFGGPIDVLNYALTLEHLEAAFYRDGLAAIGQNGITALGFQAGVFDYLSEIGAHEAAHVATLSDVITQLGGTPVQEGTYDFGYADAAGFIQVAQALEDTGLDAYTGAAQYLIENDELLTAALTIHGIEGRHASYLAILNAQVPYPEAFEAPLAPSEVLDIAGQFIQ
ncbi:MAG: ferritin-like domain-containing protein [Chloroflexota bacterium]|nr:ferritin-like domain-containing protein [Chloroflexota bacterium]